MPFKPIPRDPKTCPYCTGLFVHSTSVMCRACRVDWVRMRTGASRAVFKAIAQGRLKPLDDCRCFDCPAGATDYDHRDYNYPEAVQPTCRSCNARRGSGIPSQEFLDGVQARIRGHGYKKLKSGFGK